MYQKKIEELNTDDTGEQCSSPSYWHLSVGRRGRRIENLFTPRRRPPLDGPGENASWLGICKQDTLFKNVIYNVRNTFLSLWQMDSDKL